MNNFKKIIDVIRCILFYSSRELTVDEIFLLLYLSNRNCIKEIYMPLFTDIPFVGTYSPKFQLIDNCMQHMDDDNNSSVYVNIWRQHFFKNNNNLKTFHITGNEYDAFYSCLCMKDINIITNTIDKYLDNLNFIDMKNEIPEYYNLRKDDKILCDISYKEMFDNLNISDKYENFKRLFI